MLSKDIEIDFQDKFGNTALLYAIMKDHSEIVEILLKKSKRIKFLNLENKSVFEYVNPNNKKIKDLLKNIK
jgi:ankyrin repeat protein